MKLILILCLSISSVLAQDSQPSYIPITKLLKSKGYQLGIYGESFSTSKKVDSEGTKQDLGDKESFGRIQSEASGFFGATNSLQFGAGFRFRKNQATFDEGGESVTGSSTGLQSTFFSMMYAFNQVDKMQYTLEGLFRYTPYTNEEFNSLTDDSKVLVLGDTGNEMSAGLGMTYMGKNQKFFTLRAGYRRPGADLSNEIYWSAEGAMAWKNVALVAGVDGVNSLKDDPYDGDPLSVDRPILNTKTNLYNSINREWITPYAGINFAFAKTWRLELRGSQVVSGNSTDLGSAFGVNLIRRVDKSQTRVIDSKFKTYDLEASVTKVSPKKEYVVIDKGLADDFYKGMKIDFFEFDYVGGNVLVASGVVVQTKSGSCIVKITHHYNTSKEIKEGLIGRTSLK